MRELSIESLNVIRNHAEDDIKANAIKKALMTEEVFLSANLVPIKTALEFAKWRSGEMDSVSKDIARRAALSSYDPEKELYNHFVFTFSPVFAKVIATPEQLEEIGVDGFLSGKDVAVREIDKWNGIYAPCSKVIYLNNFGTVLDYLISTSWLKFY